MQTGDKAPGFTLPDQNGNMISLKDFYGKTVVLYFYPKDNTPGCTRQACAFAAKYNELVQKETVVIGISRDSTASHKKFADKHDLPFILLSDPEHQIIEQYGAWQEKKLYGKVSMGIVRTTFVINGNGIITHIMPKVKPDTNAEEILALL
jgi:peroxiredoxin Q/BCP